MSDSLALRHRLRKRWLRLKRRLYLANPLVDRGLRHYLLGRLFLEDVAKAKKDVFFIQIGAHDGVTADFLHDTVVNRRWKGILVEPVRELFDRLVENKKHVPGLVFENVAISSQDETRIFYAIDPRIKTHYPAWSDMLGSFNRDVILKSRSEIPDIENYIVEREVTCLSFSSLLAKHNVTHFDVLLIDVEGFDYEILKQVDFNRYKPCLVIFEYVHLSKEDLRAALGLMKTHGYRTKRTTYDIIARLRTP